MSSHHVQRLFNIYQDPDSVNLLLLFHAVLYGGFVRHENSSEETGLLWMPRGTLSPHNESDNLKKKTFIHRERGCLGTNAEDSIKDSRFHIEMVGIGIGT